MDEARGFLQERAPVEAGLACGLRNAGENAVEKIPRGRQNLADRGLAGRTVDGDHVGKGAPDIDCECVHVTQALPTPGGGRAIGVFRP